MFKKLTVLSFLPSILICIVLNLILFFTVPSERLECLSFWIAWAFTFPVNISIAVPVWIYAHNRAEARREDVINYFPPLTYIIWIATAAYLVSGAVLMYAPVESPVVPILVDVIISCGYGLVLYYAFFVTNRISDTQIETKQKVDYIKLLQADLESCFYNVSDQALLSKLRALSEAIRFSDPMSHPSLASVEAELTEVVNAIARRVRSSDIEGIESEITKAVGLVEYRNTRCKVLK